MLPLNVLPILILLYDLAMFFDFLKQFSQSLMFCSKISFGRQRSDSILCTHDLSVPEIVPLASVDT
jgi:hypothetical protein